MSRFPRIALTVLSLALVLWLVNKDLGKTNPGEISAVHAGVTTFLGDPDCAACHGEADDNKSLARACLECHAPIAKQREQQTGLHGVLSNEQRNDCGSCHSDHHGLDFLLAGDLAFTLAGFQGIEGFDHSTLDFSLKEKHLELSCDACHKESATKVIAKGHSRFLDLDATCTACHEDTHEGEMGNDCASCHGQSFAFEEVSTFDHLAEFPLQDVHDRLACSACHATSGETSIPAEQKQALATRDCIACHESPHMADISVTTDDCISCHGLDQGSFMSAQDRFTEEQHAQCGFLLTNPHQDISCNQCHDSQLESYSARFPGRPADRCAECHTDPHLDQFLQTSEDFTDCLRCHSREAFLPSLFDAKQHEQTAFPLKGEHLNAECADCHQPSPEFANEENPFVKYSNAETTCSKCHDDPHGGSFAATAARLDLDDDCAACHSPIAFSPTTEPFDHGLWTGFALQEAHDKAECSVCHLPLENHTPNGRSFAPVDELFQKHDVCADCHKDPHEGSFDLAAYPQSIEGRTSCARCHDQTDFSAVDARTFDHALWTDFPLLGAHAQSRCVDCHGEAQANQLGAGNLGRVQSVFPRFRSGQKSNRCDTCHQNPHGRNFQPPRVPAVLRGETSCARCHSEESFRVQTQNFDHNRFTLFPLEGVHARTECSSCHLPSPRARADGRSFLPAAGRECVSCHADPHAGQFRNRKSCTDCHGMQGSFQNNLRFQHATDSRFQLDETHADLACVACHRAYPLPNGGQVTRYLPLGTECSDCHSFR